MERTEALRSISYELVEYIQESVPVDFDHIKQMPTSFLFAGKTYRIREILGRFRLHETSPQNAFLICAASDEVYFLNFTPGL